jgi:hypothetical protein
MHYGNLRILDDFLTSEQAAGVFFKGAYRKGGSKIPFVNSIFPHPRQSTPNSYI